MERMLQKMARQLNAYDEASLLALWDKYATLVERFEPTKRWEEAALVFSLIQAVRLKNQLFNQHLAAELERAHFDGPVPGMDKAREWFEQQMQANEAKKAPASEVGTDKGKPKQRGKILSFRGRKGDKPV